MASGSPLSIGLLGAGSGVGAKLDGPVPLKLTDSSSSTVNFGSGSTGQFKQVSGDLWFCVTGSGSDRWRRITGPEGAGSYVAISPSRAYDSRWSGQTRLTAGSSRLVSVADKHDLTGAVTATNVVPAGARAVTYNLTVANTQIAGGYLSVVPGDSSDYSTSAINWSGNGLVLANGATVKLDTSRQLKVYCGGGSTDFIVDVTGYYL